VILSELNIRTHFYPLGITRVSPLWSGQNASGVSGSTVSTIDIVAGVSVVALIARRSLRGVWWLPFWQLRLSSRTRASSVPGHLWRGDTYHVSPRARARAASSRQSILVSIFAPISGVVRSGDFVCARYAASCGCRFGKESIDRHYESDRGVRERASENRWKPSHPLARLLWSGSSTCVNTSAACSYITGRVSIRLLAPTSSVSSISSS